MKNLHKKTAYILSLLLVVAFTACDSLSSGYDFTKQELVDKAKSKILEEIPNDALIAKITFLNSKSSSGFSKEYDIFQVMYYEANSTELKQLNILKNSSSDWKLTDSQKRDYSPENAIFATNFDFSKIIANITKAEEIVKAEKHPFSGLGTYTIATNSKTKDIEHVFSLLSQADASKNSLKNGKIVQETSYYEVKFSVINNGEININEE